LLLVCAGSPTLQAVTNSANEAQRKFYPGIPDVTVQRLSDWSNGIRVPQRFESFEFVARALIGKAKRRKTPPPMHGLYNAGR
jgi:hypothetical protein